MSYVFRIAFNKAMNVMAKERIEAHESWRLDPDNEVKKVRYETYKSILERLDTLT